MLILVKMYNSVKNNRISWVIGSLSDENKFETMLIIEFIAISLSKIDLIFVLISFYNKY